MPVVKPLRADARRNREAILSAASDVFEASGIMAPIDVIASVAGVGNATLYRNFPTRDDLLAAVMEDSVQALIERSDELATSLSAGDALLEWMVGLAWGLRVWHDLPSCIASAIDDTESPVQDATLRLIDRTRDFLERAVAAGSASHEVDALQVFELVTALSWAIDRFGDDPARARGRVVLGTAGILQPNPA